MQWILYTKKQRLLIKLMGKTKKNLGIIALMFFGLAIPIMTVLFSKFGLDRYKGMKAEMVFLKDSIQIKDFKLISFENQPITKKDVEGKVFIINYLDAECPEKKLTQTLKELKRIQAEYKKEDGHKILFLTHLNIPQEDSITTAIDYVKKYKLDTTNWKIAIQPQGNIQTTVTENYKLPKEKLYSTLAIVDPRGYLCNHYNTEDKENINKMMAHMTVLIPVKERKKLEYRADKKLYE